MGDRESKTALFDALASMAQAMASGRRAELIDVLGQGERSVEELAAEIDQSVANTSQHLQRLLHAGLVRTRREGTRVHYALAGPRVAELWRALRVTAEEHLSGLSGLVDAYLGDRDGLEQITRDELRQRLRSRDVVVLDVRPVREYAAGHVAGAVSVPVAELKDRLGEISEGATVVAYCRGAYCVYADDAVRTLRAHGRTALRLEDGYPEWKAAGLPVSG
jgi:rhodanese-related sulfurtransferase